MNKMDSEFADSLMARKENLLWKEDVPSWCFLQQRRVLAGLASRQPKTCRSSSGFVSRIGGWKNHQGGVTLKD